MSGYAHGIVSVWDYIDAGLRLEISAARTLKLYRESGGQIRTEEFYERWKQREITLYPSRSTTLAPSEAV